MIAVKDVLQQIDGFVDELCSLINDPDVVCTLDALVEGDYVSHFFDGDYGEMSTEYPLAEAVISLPERDLKYILYMLHALPSESVLLTREEAHQKISSEITNSALEKSGLLQHLGPGDVEELKQRITSILLSNNREWRYLYYPVEDGVLEVMYVKVV